MKAIKMVDLQGQYLHIREEVDEAMRKVIDAADFIQGKAVGDFEKALSDYLGGTHVVSCGNGTDALQIAMMALGLEPGDEVILPVFTYPATAEIIALLRLVPVLAEVDETTFTLDPAKLERLVTAKTVAIVPVHLYGQCAHMEPILELAKKYDLHVIEDAAQSLSADYFFLHGPGKKAGTIGTIGTTSFFPAKNLGAFGDGGAMFTHDLQMAQRLRMIANHGQQMRYHHDVVGVNSRLDTLQAAILRVKLNYLNGYNQKRREVADYYDAHLVGLPFLKTPARAPYSSHVFHQYTVTTRGIDRNKFRDYLHAKGIPSMIYYPLPLHFQKAYRQEGVGAGAFPIGEKLASCVLSLPMHTEMDEEQLEYICSTIKGFVN